MVCSLPGVGIRGPEVVGSVLLSAEAHAFVVCQSSVKFMSLMVKGIDVQLPMARLLPFIELLLCARVEIILPTSL
jgi:hypothetical protein